QLVLLRFADALKELGHTAGLQVHRSHWIADADV
ncbi:DNA-binding response regulator, partial [Rhizobium sp. BR5]